MLLNGVAPNDENKFGLTPVHLGKLEHKRVLETLRNLFYLAAKCGHADVFDVFAKTGVSLRQPSSKIGMTALHIAGTIIKPQKADYFVNLTVLYLILDDFLTKN